MPISSTFALPAPSIRIPLVRRVFDFSRRENVAQRVTLSQRHGRRSMYSCPPASDTLFVINVIHFEQVEVPRTPPA